MRIPDPPVDRSTTVHKVLNNNVVISIDPLGRERVLMGRGLGFQLKPDDAIDPAKVEKTFILETGEQGERERQMFEEVPYAVISAVTRAVDGAERSLGRILGRRLGVAVVDHIQFLMERLDEGLRIPSASMPELRVLHPAEFSAAEAMVRSLSADLGRDFPEEEAVFLTMHVLNATRDEPNGTAALLFRRVHHVIGTVEKALGVALDTESNDYVRFVLHVQFLLQRLVDRSMLTGGDTSFFEFARHNYPVSYRIALDVKDYVRAATEAELTDEELLYLIVHLERLRAQLGRDAEAQDAGEHDAEGAENVVP